NDRAIGVKLRSGMAGVIREFLDASVIGGNRRGRWNLEVGWEWRNSRTPGRTISHRRLWDLLWLLRMACDKAKNSDRIPYQVLVDVHGNGRSKLVKLWALCGP